MTLTSKHSTPVSVCRASVYVCVCVCVVTSCGDCVHISPPTAASEPGHAGPGSKCLEERATALTHLELNTPLDIYVPECQADGSFANVQCHNATGYCWCVSPDGKPFTGYTVLGRSRINCHRRNLQAPTSSGSYTDLPLNVPVWLYMTPCFW